MNCALKKLKSRRGSGIAEALVGFLISVLSVLILFGIVSTAADLIKQGDIALEKFYNEEKILDLYNIAGAAKFQESKPYDDNDGELHVEYSIPGESAKKYTISINGDPENDPELHEVDMDADSSSLEGAYFVTSKYHMFAFSTD